MQSRALCNKVVVAQPSSGATYDIVAGVLTVDRYAVDDVVKLMS